jgi:uncharacterized membrane protein YphA (DoxX/SURF4 family)
MASKLATTRLPLLLVTILRILVSGIFLYAGVLKLQDADGTLVAVYQYHLLSWQMAGVLAVFLPFVEITAALGLWIPRLQLGASLLVIGLNLLFITALASAVARNLDVSCGCFGTTDLRTTSGIRLAEDAILLLLCLPLWLHARSKHYAQLHSAEDSGY